MLQSESPLISVVLCTYNRCELMTSALQSVCVQAIDQSNYEVIVVDNNSTDQTKEYVAIASRRYPNVRYCFEARQGLSHARNAGLHAARGQYVAYIDDDCTVPAEWLCVAQDVIDRVTPGIFGGPYRPFYNSQKPHWYRDSYGAHDGGSVARLFGECEYLSGTNLFIRRTLLEQLCGFSPNVGMSGAQLGYGEEVVIQRRVRCAWPDEAIYYDPKLEVFHLVREEKMTLFWCAKQMFVLGRYWQRVLNDTGHKRVHALRSSIRACRAVFCLVKALTWGIALRDRSQYPFAENYLCEVVFVQLRAMGEIYEQFTYRLR